MEFPRLVFCVFFVSREAEHVWNVWLAGMKSRVRREVKLAIGGSFVGV